MNYQTTLDIANRALQHCGRERILTLNDVSSAAQEIAFCFDKIRRAELRRNVWRFATKRVVLRPLDSSSYQTVPTTWSKVSKYGIGGLVTWNGSLYLSFINDNTNQQPDLNPTSWALYFGPTIANLWRDPGQGSPTSYWAGELVYLPQNENYVVYMSLTSGNTDTPGVYPQWSTTTVYNEGDTVQYGTSSLLYTPGLLPVFYTPGHLAIAGSFGNWVSNKDLNVGIPPTSGSPSWTHLPDGDPDNRVGQNWLQLDTGLRAFLQPYPLTAGPVTQITTKNAYVLPNGFLREAPQDPKAGAGVYLGALGALPYTDWTWEGNFIVSGSVSPIMLRFVADVQDVNAMDDMFCEGLAVRIAREIAPKIVPKPERVTRMRELEALYKEIMGEARTVNGIETGAVDPPMDDYIMCRF